MVLFNALGHEVLAVLIGVPLHGRIEQLVLERGMDVEFGEDLLGDALLFLVRPVTHRVVLSKEFLHVCVICFEEINRVRHPMLLPPECCHVSEISHLTRG
jgi:hypothetical protein